MKPHSIYNVRSDSVHLICSICDADKDGEKFCIENDKDFSHGICPDCARNPVPAGEVFPVKKEEPPFRSAGFLLRHRIETAEDMEKFLNGEL